MDKVTILSRIKFLEFVPTEEDVVAIRIGNVPPIKDNASKRYLDVLNLGFYDDIVKYAEDIDRSTTVDSNRFTKEQAIEIQDYLKKYSDKKFVIHCEEGKSRSSAVGYYILKELGYLEELNDKKQMYFFKPNKEVYGLLIGTPYARKTGSYIIDELTRIDDI